jgi:hypothetical protein
MAMATRILAVASPDFKWRAAALLFPLLPLTQAVALLLPLLPDARYAGIRRST